MFLGPEGQGCCWAAAPEMFALAATAITNSERMA
jgi:hypothetical protein